MKNLIFKILLIILLSIFFIWMADMVGMGRGARWFLGIIVAIFLFILPLTFVLFQNRLTKIAINKAKDEGVFEAYDKYFDGADEMQMLLAKKYGAESKNFKSLYPDNTDEFIKELKENLIKEFGKDSDEYLEYFPKKKDKLPLEHSAKVAGFKE